MGDARSARPEPPVVGGRETCLTAGIRAGTRGAKLLSVTNDLYHPPLLACTVRSYHRLVAEVAQQHSRLR